MSHKEFNQIEETLAEVDAEINAGAAGPAEGDDEGRRSQTDIIVEYIRDRAELFHGDNDVAYARDMDSGEVRRIDGRAFRNWLADGFYRHTEKAVRDQALREARMTLEGMAMQEYRPVHVRAAGSSGRYWLDIAEPGSSLAIRIEPGRWSLEESGLMFTRADSAQPLPNPGPGGDINLLWRIANVPEGFRLLVIAWLVECLRPDTPYPVVELLGEHGSAKSTAAQALRKLIDPNDADLRGAPTSATDLFVSAGTNHFVCLENISHLPAPIQDAMCVIATGGGFARRKLYTDADESVITVKRPIIINGIAAAITRQDLVSRTITVELPVIRDAKERDKLDADFEANRPAILGALLDIAAKALEHLPDMKLPPERRPRLLEFVLLGMAVAKAMGRDPEEFLAEYETARQDGLERTLEASPVATAIRDWAETNPGEARELPAGQWLAILEDFKPRGIDSWPRSAKGLADAMRRAAPALRQLGVYCECQGRLAGNVLWRVGQRKLANQCPESPEVLQADQKTADPQDFRTFRTSDSTNSLDDAEGF